MNNKTSTANLGVVASVRGSVVDVRFDGPLPPIYSVLRAGCAAYRAVAGDLKLAYAQFEELETFARFGARLDEDTRRINEHGRRIRRAWRMRECR
jgi:F0F1-type ATP synthase alpha subunit